MPTYKTADPLDRTEEKDFEVGSDILELLLTNRQTLFTVIVQWIATPIGYEVEVMLHGHEKHIRTA